MVLGKTTHPPSPSGQLLSPQALIRSLTRRPGYSSLVGDISIESNSLSEPAEHVGTHSGGVFGCLAELGSDGIAGVTTALLSGCEALLQALKSTASTLSIAARCGQLLLGFCICFLRSGLAPLVFLNDEDGRTPVALCNLGAVVGQIALCPNGYSLSR